MKSFTVKVRSPLFSHDFTALGACSFDVLDAALRTFGICYVSVRPA